MRIFYLIFLFLFFHKVHLSQFTYAPAWDSKHLSTGFPTPDGKPWDDQNVYMRYLMDADGDGRLDIAGFGYGFFVSLSCGQGFGEPFMWMDSTAYSPSTGWPNYNTYPRLIADVDKDGYNDVIAFGSSLMVSVYSTNSYTWKGVWASSFSAGSYPNQNSAPRLVGDFDGDGYPDIVGFSSTSGLRVEKGTGTSFSSATTWLADFLSSGGWDTFDTHPRFVADVDGDGKDDVIGCGPNGVLVAISTGSSFTASIWLNDFSVSQGWTTYQQFPRAMADVDGDGKADLIGFKDGVWVALAGSGSFSAPTLWYSGLSYSSSSTEWLTYNAAPRFLGDVNCDGKADIVAFSGTGGGITVYMSGTSTTDSCTAISNCSLCTPGSSSCSFCETLPRWPSSSGGCECPGGGTLAYSTAKCSTKNPTITLSSTLDCQNVNITYEIPAEEIAFYDSIGVLVDLTDTGNNATKTAELQSLLDDQFIVSGTYMTIPRDNLVSGVTYTLNMSRYISEGTVVSAITTFSLASGTKTSFVEPSSSSNCHFLRDTSTTINGEITSGGVCPEDVTVSISQISGPTLDSSYLVSTTTNSKQILSCAFLEANHYSFSVTGSSASDPSFSITKTYDFTVPYDEIKVSIPNANPVHDYNTPITVSPTITNSRNCPFQSNDTVNYLYNCTRRSPNALVLVTCPDASAIFGVNTTSSSLIIPVAYLEQSSDMIITVTVYAGPRSVTSSTYYNITNQNNLIISMSCLSSQCSKYNPDITYELLATVTNDPGSGYTLDWFVSNPSIITFANFTHLKFSGPSIPGSNLLFNVLVQSPTYTGSGTFSLPINTPPTPGTLEVSPSSGLSFLTQFSLSASGWTDEDTPLMYQYSYFFNNGTENAISQFQLSPNTNTYLPGDSPAIDVWIILKVHDSYGAEQRMNKSVSVNSNSANLDATLNSVGGIVDSMSVNLQSTILQSALIADELKNSQDDLMNLRTNLQSCTGCAVGEVFCLYGQCNCKDLTDSLVDCSISTSLINKSLALNEALIDKIDETYRLITANPNLTPSEISTLRESALSSFKAISANPIFNSNTTIHKMYESLNNTLGLLSPNTTLNYAQSATVAGFMSNSYKFFSSFSDCNCTTEECLRLEKSTGSYLEKISADSVKNQIAGSNPTYISTDIFDIATRRTSICEVGSGELAPSPQSASISFYKLSKKNDSDCKVNVDSYYYAFPNRSALFNCNSTTSNTPKIKDFIMIKMVDGSTQKSVADKFSVVPTMPPGISCPSGCTGQVGGSCFCPPALFDVGAQLSLLFKRSNLYAFSNIGALLSWKWYTSPMFWVNIGFLAWYLITVHNLRKKKYRDMCVIDNVKPVSTLTKGGAFKNIVFVASNILSMYFLKKTELTKITRVTLYYFRLVLHGTFASIFSSVNENKGFVQLLTELEIYVILLPYFTVIPLNLLFTKILTDSSKRLNVTKGEKCKSCCTGFVMALVILGGIFAMFVVAANKSEEAQLPWAVILIVSFIQDMFVSPIVFVILQTIFTQLVIFAQRKNHPKLLKIMGPKVDENFNQVFVKLPIHPKYKVDIVDLKAKELAKQKAAADASMSFVSKQDEGNRRKISLDSNNTENQLIGMDTPKAKAPLSRFHQQQMESKKANDTPDQSLLNMSKMMPNKKEGDEEESVSLNDIEIAKRMQNEEHEQAKPTPGNAEPFTIRFDSEVFDEKHPEIDIRAKD